MKKLSFVCAALLMLSACGEKKETAVESEKPVIKIGVSLPLTGTLAFMGDMAKDAVLMNFDKWKGKDTRYTYELVIEDDGFEPKKIAQAGNKLINFDKVNAVVSLFDLPAYYYFDQATKLDFVHLTCAWGDDLSDKHHNFNNITSHAEQAQRLVGYMKKLGVKNVGYVLQNNKGPLHLKDNMKRELQKAGIDLVFEETFNIGNKDFRLFLAEIKDKQVDVIMTVLLPPDMYAFAKQKHEMGIKTPMTTVDYFNDAEDKSIFESYYFVMSSMGTDDFKKELSEKNENEVKACVANMYDNLDLLIWAYENADTLSGEIPSTEAVSEKLHSVKGRIGAVGKMDVKENGRIESRAYLKEIKNGKVVDLKD